MKIGILTFYKVANFGANLQAISTYYYLKNNGYIPIFINYMSEYTEQEWTMQKRSLQAQTHANFINNIIKEQTTICHTTEEIKKVIEDHNIEAIIVGSDAVVQHHPLLSRIKMGKRKPFYISHPRPESMFPNPFWGIDLASEIPMSMMSVSSQNSAYNLFSGKLKQRMKETLSFFKYISVRDSWTKKMMENILNKQIIEITPDPVFAFNYNASNIIPSEKEIRKRFNLPNYYVLISLHSQSLSLNTLNELKREFEKKGITCVALPMPFGFKFKHPFNYKINTPLSPIDWYALIKYSYAYIGSNMHPIVVSLHNSVPCFSIDHWGTRNFFNRSKKDGSSKVAHILSVYGLQSNRREIEGKQCMVNASEIVNAIYSFPKEYVTSISKKQYEAYSNMMQNILNSLKS
ncbi:MAG: polysaccharide pyruvyl transferase family protein [Bacteroides sp.]|jgi:hypothetical protein|nr:polysaccharide pyruvyl transferase family protein [Bacteroides sp.]